MGAMLLTEWNHGSDLLSNQTVARPVAQGHRIDGSKALINGGRHHRLLTVLARTRDVSPDGKAGYGDHTLFWLERDEAVVAKERHRTLPTRGADISSVDLRGAFVPPGSIVGQEGDGFSVVRRTLALSRGGIAALCAGAVAAAGTLAREHAMRRVLYGKPIAELGSIADHLAELAELDAQCSAVALRAAAYANAFGPSAAPFTAAAKLVAPRIAERATDVARRVLGSRALLEDHNLARFVRDVPLYGIFDGTQHVMLEELSYGLDRIARGRRLDEACVLDRVRQAWTTPPRPLTTVGRDRTRLWPIDPRRVADSLGDSKSWEWTQALSVLAGTLVELPRRLAVAELWTEQAIRFDLAEASAWLDVCFACIEVGSIEVEHAIGDGSKRAGAGRSPGASGFAGADTGPGMRRLLPEERSWFEAGGCRSALVVARSLREVASACRWRPPALENIETQLLELAAAARRSCAQTQNLGQDQLRLV